MPDRVPENNAAFIETECLKAAPWALGCSELQSLKTDPLKPSGSGPTLKKHTLKRARVESEFPSHFSIVVCSFLLFSGPLHAALLAF
jgi:hypothetical protein